MPPIWIVPADVRCVLPALARAVSQRRSTNVTLPSAIPSAVARFSSTQTVCSSRKRSSVAFALRASAHRWLLLFAQALIGGFCSSRKRSSVAFALRASAHRWLLLFAQALIGGSD